MLIGVPKEIKNNENRVSMTPAGVHAVVKLGHEVLVEKGAGAGSEISDEEYYAAGAKIINRSDLVFSRSDLIVKVKEPIESEYELLKPGQTLFTYLHLAPNAPLTNILLLKKVTGIAYETVQLANGTLPLLSPMSEVAGRMSVQIGAGLLQKNNGGSGILLSGVPGVLPAEVLIVGGGVVGTNAAKIAAGMGARVTVTDISKHRLAALDDMFCGRVSTLLCNEYDLAQAVRKADLLIGAVLIPGARAPKLVTGDMVKSMKKGSVIIDVAVDQGGSVETVERPTTHDNPCFEKYGVLHYAVANIPGAVPRTSTFALAGATLPYLAELLKRGPVSAMMGNKALLAGLNTYRGYVTCEAVARDLKLNYTPAAEIFALEGSTG